MSTPEQANEASDGQSRLTAELGWQFADQPPAGYQRQYGTAQAGDMAYWNKDSEWKRVRHGQNIVGAYEGELWGMGILALATRIPNAPGKPTAANEPNEG